MADEQTTETPVVETQPDVQAETPKPHPLEPGGERWNEIYRERSEFKREAESWRERAERLERELASKPSPQAQPPQKVYSEAELQALVDQGRITPAQMAAQIAIQVSTATKQEIRRELEQSQKIGTARGEIQDYITKIPALSSPTSDEFRKVSRVANEIADEWGVDVLDARVQRRALREAFGPLDKLAKVEQAREFNRTHADTYVESGGGGGSTSAQTDPLKDIDSAYVDHWKKLGYTREQMIEEAKFVKRAPRRTVSR